MNALNQQLMGKEDAAETAVRRKIATLQKAYHAAKAKTQALKRARNWREMHKAQQAERKAAIELNKGLAQVDQYELRVANALWGEKTYQFLPEFLNTLARNYGAGMRLVDFVNAPEESRKTINDWVSKETEGRITS